MKPPNLAAIRARSKHNGETFDAIRIAQIIKEDIPALCDALEASQAEVERLLSCASEPLADGNDT